MREKLADIQPYRFPESSLWMQHNAGSRTPALLLGELVSCVKDFCAVSEFVYL